MPRKWREKMKSPPLKQIRSTVCPRELKSRARWLKNPPTGPCKTKTRTPLRRSSVVSPVMTAAPTGSSLRVCPAAAYARPSPACRDARMLDLIVRNATLPERTSTLDIGCLHGEIVEISPRIEAEAARILDAKGHLVSPPFVDAHFHMDATLSLGIPRLNQSGTLLEGIALWGELKPLLDHETVIERALRYCDLAVAQGLLAIRSHVDICDDRLLCVEALLELRKKVAPYLDLQLVAFPQDGYFRSPNAAANLERALDMGVDVVGGIPHFERTMADGAASVKALCELGAKRGLLIDMHCDESDDPLSRHIETLAYETQRL